MLQVHKAIQIICSRKTKFALPCLFVTASGEPPLLLAASVHCATRNAIAAARKEIYCSGSGSSSPPFFELEVPAVMPVVKELCGLDNVEKYLETLVGTQ